MYKGYWSKQIIYYPCKTSIFNFKGKYLITGGFPGGSAVKNLPANAGDTGSISGSGRSPGGGNGNPLQYSCLGNPVGRGAWWATVHGVMKESDMTEQLNNNKHPLENAHVHASCGPLAD